MDNVQKCPVCGYQNITRKDRFSKGERYFCVECGAFLKRNTLSDVDVAKIQEMKLARIIENIKYVPHSKVLWNDIIDRYVSNVEKYLALYELDDIKQEYRREIKEKFDAFLNICSSSDFEIAFVGTIKTGKSTLINALLGKNYASMAVTPETAALTKFRSSKKDYIKITFYTKEEWTELWHSISSGADTFLAEYEYLNGDKYKDDWIGHPEIRKEILNDSIQEELKRWSSSQSPEHYFVKEIEVGISELSDDFPEHVVFVDTPGLSDPVVYRSNITKEYIRRANAVFVCVDAGRMYKEETETLSSVFSFSYNNKKKVHVIATCWDRLNDPILDWEEQYKWLLKQLVGKAFFDDVETAKTNILYTSAYIYNLCRDYAELSEKEIRQLKRFSFNFDDNNSIDTRDLYSCLDFFKEICNVDKIKSVITEHLISNYKEILNKDISARYEDIVYNLKRTIRESKKNSQDIIEISSADVDKMIQKIDAQKKSYEEIVKCKEDLEYVLAVVTARTEHNLDVILKKIDSDGSSGKKFVPPKKKPKKNAVLQNIKKIFE